MKILFFLMISLGPSIAFGQLGVAYHQSGLPFAGINYEFGDRFRPEVRIGTDSYFDGFTVEGVFTYDILNKDAYEFYGGVGVRAADSPGVVIPIGFNFYPFAVKNFGFHMELSPIFDEDGILRGSFGIRYRFRGEQSEKAIE